MTLPPPTAPSDPAVVAPSPPQHCSAQAGYITSASIPFPLRKSWEQGLAGSHLEATRREAVPEHPGPGLAPCRLSWQGDKEDPPHPLQEKAHRVHTALSAWAWAISRCRIPPHLAPGLSVSFGLLSPGFWQKDSWGERGISRQSCVPTGRQPFLRSGTPKGSLWPPTSPAPGFSISPGRQKSRAQS